MLRLVIRLGELNKDGAMNIYSVSIVSPNLMANIFLTQCRGSLGGTVTR